VDEILIPLFAIFAIFIALPWMILNFIARKRDADARIVGDPAMNSRLMSVADRLERRLDAIESLLDHEVPGWRKPAERRSA
jgi:phage shock protein B